VLTNADSFVDAGVATSGAPRIAIIVGVVA